MIPVDTVLPARAEVEATDHVEYGAQVTMRAVAHGQRMVLTSAERDGMAGPLPKGKADAAGVIPARRDGDQSGVQIGLLPMGIAEGARLKRAGLKDQVLTHDDVNLREDSIACRLRAAQDVHFPHPG